MKMKTETILNNLLKVKDNPFKYMDVLENTINELKIDIYNENGAYPEIERILPDKSYGEIAKFSFKELAAKLKAKQIEEKEGKKLIELNSDSYKCFFNADNLKKICDILGTTDLTIRLYGELKPALIIDEKTDNQAIICPIRKYC